MTRTPPWWTPADEAELAVLVWALVTEVAAHRGGCAACAAGFPPCPAVGAAIGALLDWHRARTLRSRAEHLRALQDAGGLALVRVAS